MHVVVPVHDRAAVTARFARALAAQSYADFRLLLVDDGCADDTVAQVQRILEPARLEVLRGDGTLWWAGALQMAYEHLCRPGRMNDGDAVLIVNDDVHFEPDFLQCGLEMLAEQQQAAFQAVGIDRATGRIDHGTVADLRRLHFRAARPGEVPNCGSTRGLLMAASTFVRSGGFRPRWLPHYLSDYEFTLRLQRQGTALRVDPRFRIEVDFALTGVERPPGGSVAAIWRDALSHRAKFNPLHWSAFALLACPAWVGPLHALRIWAGFARTLAHAALAPSRPPDT